MNDEQQPPRRRPGRKPTGRTVSIMSITVTPEQKATLEALSAAQGCSVSVIVRQFIDDGLATVVPIKGVSGMKRATNIGTER